MNTLPRTITNPLIGDRVTFLETAADTGGGHALVEVTLQPGGGTGVHYHVDYTEAFTPVCGILGIQLDQQQLLLAPGEQAEVPLRRLHRFYNPGTEPITFRVRIAPARQFEAMLRTAYGLANDGLVNAKGMPKNIWHLALLFEMGETYLPGLPLRLQRGLFGLLARMARRRGKDRELERYYKPVAPAFAGVTPAACRPARQAING